MLLAFFFASFLAAQAPSPPGILDPAFETIPFDQWLQNPAAAPFGFSAGVPRATLSFHQRLATQVEIELDGRNLETRRGKGELVFFLQITDRQGTRYQNHGVIDLGKVDANIKAATVQYAQPAFFLPGEYGFAVAILVTATHEHSAAQGTFRVAPPVPAALSGAWRNLPPVEFIPKAESPDSWFLPGIEARLQWAAGVHSPARLNVILNMATSAPVPGFRRTPSSGLAALLPTLKVISQTGSPLLSERIDLLDLARHRAVFQQEVPKAIEWPRLRTSLSEASTASIDVHSLSDSRRDAQFFVSEVRRIIRMSTQPCILVILTTGVAFEAGEDLEPISLEALSPCRVFYIRYRSPAPFMTPYEQQMGRGIRGGRMGGPMMNNHGAREAADQLAATLKPLVPKIFDVETPEQMARALSEVERALP